MPARRAIRREGLLLRLPSAPGVFPGFEFQNSGCMPRHHRFRHDLISFDFDSVWPCRSFSADLILPAPRAGRGRPGDPAPELKYPAMARFPGRDERMKRRSSALSGPFLPFQVIHHKRDVAAGDEEFPPRIFGTAAPGGKGSRTPSGEALGPRPGGWRKAGGRVRAPREFDEGVEGPDLFFAPAVMTAHIGLLLIILE